MAGLIPLDDISGMYEEIKEASLVGGCSVLILVAADCDAVCASRILTVSRAGGRCLRPVGPARRISWRVAAQRVWTPPTMLRGGSVGSHELALLPGDGLRFKRCADPPLPMSSCPAVTAPGRRDHVPSQASAVALPDAGCLQGALR